MGKHIKTLLDHEMIRDLAREVYRLDPDNPILKKYLQMENFEGIELRKAIKQK